MSVSQPFLTYRFLADGLGLRNHDIWPPRLDEAAPFGQAGAHRFDHEGSLIRECSEKGDWYLHFLRYMLGGTVIQRLSLELENTNPVRSIFATNLLS